MHLLAAAWLFLLMTLQHSGGEEQNGEQAA
jgi:hypothetical protein